MRIGVDAACWSNQRGYGRYTRELLKAVVELDRNNEYLFFLDPETNRMDNFPVGIKRIVVDVSETPSLAASASGHRSLRDVWKMGKTVSKENLDILFFPSVYTYFPVFGRAKKVIGIQDVIAEQFPELVFTNRRHRFFWNLKVWMAIKQADLILTLTEFSKKGIMKHFRIEGSRIRVTSAAADNIFRPIHERDSSYKILSRFGLDFSTKFILYVGGIAPHKNLSVLVKAYSKLIKDSSYKDVKLVLVGDYEKDPFLIDRKIKDEIKRLDLTDTIIFTGFLPDKELVYLYNAATILVMPSFCEGFGLPALEAMACATPVIGSKTTSLPEVVGNAGLFFDPNDPDELLEKLLHILGNDNFRKQLRDRSIKRASTFSWQKSAAQLLAAFEEFKKDGPAS